jgi:hypothetical protein
MPGQEHLTGPTIVAGVDGSPLAFDFKGNAKKVLADAISAVAGPDGAVSQHCVHHAHCPVVVIRGQDST